MKHLAANGFRVKPMPVREPAVERKRLGMPDALGSCHTAVVDGYVIEGHVPSRDIKRLLGERPRALGLAVPAMPRGSPGMEADVQDPYDVLLVHSPRRYGIYARYGRQPSRQENP
jgi:hypothetical protein